jgi:hypothetical protein
MLDNGNFLMLNLKDCGRMALTSNEMLGYFARFYPKQEFARCMKYYVCKRKYGELSSIDKFCTLIKIFNPQIKAIWKIGSDNAVHLFFSSCPCSYERETIELEDRIKYTLSPTLASTKVHWRASNFDLEINVPIDKLCTPRRFSIENLFTRHVKKLSIHYLWETKCDFSKFNTLHLRIGLTGPIDFFVLPPKIVSFTFNASKKNMKTILENICFPPTLLWLSLWMHGLKHECNIDICNFPPNLEILNIGSKEKHRALKKMYTYDEIDGTYAKCQKTIVESTSLFEASDECIINIDPKFYSGLTKLKALYMNSKNKSYSLKDLQPKMEHIEYLHVHSLWLEVFKKTDTSFPKLQTLAFVDVLYHNEQVFLSKFLEEKCPVLQQLCFSPSPVLRRLCFSPSVAGEFIDLPTLSGENPQIYLAPINFRGRAYLQSKDTFYVNYKSKQKVQVFVLHSTINKESALVAPIVHGVTKKFVEKIIESNFITTIPTKVQHLTYNYYTIDFSLGSKARIKLDN